jgi:hypothetical protein
MCKKLFLVITILLFFSCNRKENNVDFFENEGFSILIEKNQNSITVFCDPLHINKYSTSIFFGGKLQKNSFTQGYFLEKSKNKLFDTIFSNKTNNVFFKLKDNKLIVKFKSSIIGGEQLFPNNYLKNKPDTILVKKSNKNIIGLGFSRNLNRIKNEKSGKEDSFNEPFFILNSNKKDSLYVMYKLETPTHFEINKGFILRKNVIFYNLD